MFPHRPEEILFLPLHHLPVRPFIRPGATSAGRQQHTALAGDWRLAMEAMIRREAVIMLMRAKRGAIHPHCCCRYG